MKLTVGRITTKVTGGYTEIQFLHDALAIRDDKQEIHSLVEEHHGSQVFYTGLLSRATDLMDTAQVEYELEDQTPALPDFAMPTEEEIATCLPGIRLHDHQIKPVQKGLVLKRGIVDVATGGGKTEIQIALAKLTGLKTLILVTGLKAMVGAIRRCEKYGMQAGAYYGDERDLSKQITVAVDDSVYTSVKKRDREFMRFAQRECQLLILDECHHLPSTSWAISAATIEAPYRFGFSGSPFASQGELEYSDMALIGLTGEVIAQVPAWYLIEKGLLARPIVTMIEVRFPKLYSGNTNWRYCYPQGIVQNKFRNELAVELAQQLRDQDLKVLTLVHQVNHGYLLLEMLKDPSVKFSCGGDEVAVYTDNHDDEAIWGCPRECPQARKAPRSHKCSREIFTGIRVSKETSFATLDELLDMRAGIFIGSSVYNESVDIPDVTDLIVLSGMKKYRQVVQRAGRSLRPKPGQNIVRIWDFTDKTHNVLWKHSNERVAVYRHDDYRFEVNTTLDVVNGYLAKPIVFTANPLTGIMK